MNNHEQVIMAMTAEEVSAAMPIANPGHFHESHDHIETGYDTPETSHQEQQLTVRQRISRWAIGKSGIMNNPHVEQITAATCCGAVCRGDLPIVAAYVGTTVVASLRNPKDKETEFEKQEYINE